MGGSPSEDMFWRPLGVPFFMPHVIEVPSFRTAWGFCNFAPHSDTFFSPVYISNGVCGMCACPLP